VTAHDFGSNVSSRVLIRNTPDPIIHTDFVVKELGKIGYKSVMIEGGKSVITSFISQGNWDEISIFIRPSLLARMESPCSVT